jgi:hypothetical protein
MTVIGAPEPPEVPCSTPQAALSAAQSATTPARSMRRRGRWGVTVETAVRLIRRAVMLPHDSFVSLIFECESANDR